MLLRSLLFCLALLVGYELLVRTIDAWWATGQNNLQNNIVRAQEYMYNAFPSQNIMVGSSLSARLSREVPDDSLPPHFTNLSFNGQSLYDGLEIVKAQSLLPKRLYIEANLFMRNEDPKLLNYLFSPIMYPLRRWVHAFRDRNQPIGILARLPLAVKGNPRFIHYPSANDNRDERTYQIMLTEKVANNSKSIDSLALVRQSNKLGEYITYFQQKEVEVIFFVMPVDCTLEKTKSARQIVEAVRQLAGQYHCLLIEAPPCGQYVTADGNHLQPASVFRFLRYFRHELARRNAL